MRRKQIYYSAELKAKKIAYYVGLPEKQARHFLAMEYETYGSGSMSYLSEVFRCSRNRIARGHSQLVKLRLDNQPATYDRQRKKGGGSKKKRLPNPTLVDSSLITSA